MDKNAKIYIAGHHGLVGSAIWNNLKARGYENLVGRSHKELDLLDPVQVKKFFDEEQPDAVVLAAAHVGGIMANLQYRADFIYKNLQIQQNVIGESWKHGVKKLLFLGSTCIYPGEAPQPMPEDCLLTSPLEYTNEPYAIAKIAGLKMCESFNIQYGTNYIAVMPTNLYGPNDNFHLENSHVLPAMVRKIHLAKCPSPPPRPCDKASGASYAYACMRLRAFLWKVPDCLYDVSSLHHLPKPFHCGDWLYRPKLNIRQKEVPWNRICGIYS